MRVCHPFRPSIHIRTGHEERKAKSPAQSLADFIKGLLDDIEQGVGVQLFELQ
jgi:hypothetical protein